MYGTKLILSYDWKCSAWSYFSRQLCQSKYISMFPLCIWLGLNLYSARPARKLSRKKKFRPGPVNLYGRSKHLIGRDSWKLLRSMVYILAWYWSIIFFSFKFCLQLLCGSFLVFLIYVSLLAFAGIQSWYHFFQG